jgi:hypothetical protein
MHRPPRRFSWCTFAATLIALLVALRPLAAAGQAETLPAPLPPAQTPTASAPPEAPPATKAITAPVDDRRQQELASLFVRLRRQRAGNRRWQAPTIGIALGFVTLAAGGLVYLQSMSNLGDLPCDEDNAPCGINDRQLYAGLTLMAIGTALFFISAPMLMVRRARAARVQRTEAAIRRLGGQVSFAPTVSPRGEAGFRLRARF